MIMDRHEEIQMIRKLAEARAEAEERDMPDEEPYVLFENVRKVYHVGEVDIEALADASFSVRKGELAVVVGESGAGKTTLLNILGGMDTLTSGRAVLDGREISKMNTRELTNYRRYDIGFVFQFYNLVQNMTALENVRKVYHVGEVDIEALADASFSVRKGELAVVVGESGAGKTTLLNILGGMDTLTSGRAVLDGREISKMNTRELTNYRRYDIGFVFQFYNLVQNLTALENVSLATQICKDPLDPRETLKAVGLEERMNNFPGQLSGGEQQRVAIARALAKNPKLLLCDEPTGALDYVTGKQILQLLQDQARNMGTTVIIITHNKAITPMADRVISVRSGRVQSVEVNREPLPISEIEW